MNKKEEQPEFIFRNCPKCKKELKYKNTVNSRCEVKKSIEAGRLCISCAQRANEKIKGPNNYWYGKPIPHWIGKPGYNKGGKQTGAWLENSRRTIKIAKASQQGKSYFQIWVEKFGEEEALRKMQAVRDLKSLQSSGEKNGMFRRPAPNGSGNGWKGKYRDETFRSLRELCFLIESFEKNIKFKSLHASKEYRIPYIGEKGQKRNYYPDFFLYGSNTLLEIKPVKLWKTIGVTAKADAAKIFCEGKDWKYELRDYDLDEYKTKILEKYLDKSLIFDKRYEERFKKLHNIQ